MPNPIYPLHTFTLDTQQQHHIKHSLFTTFWWKISLCQHNNKSSMSVCSIAEYYILYKSYYILCMLTIWGLQRRCVFCWSYVICTTILEKYCYFVLLFGFGFFCAFLFFWGFFLPNFFCAFPRTFELRWCGLHLCDWKLHWFMATLTRDRKSQTHLFWLIHELCRSG